jgi:chemotaxis protein CheC
MSADKPILDEFFIDAVAEVINVGMGSAAASLSEMVNEEVKLSVPGVEFVTRGEAENIIGSRVKTNLSGVKQHFDGAFSGEAILLFPEKQSLELVRAVVGDEVALNDLTEMEQDAMKEIGNVILNACLCAMADMFGQKLRGEIPGFVKGTVGQIFASENNNILEKDIVLLLKMDFAIERKNIQGYVTFLMDMASIDALKHHIQNLMDVG